MGTVPVENGGKNCAKEKLFHKQHPESRFLIQQGLVGLKAFHVSGKFQKVVRHIHDTAPALPGAWIDRW